jgi:hypothetical protein
VHDVAAFESAGVPAVFLATEQFMTARDAQASALGIEPAAVWVPHPIQDRTDDEMIEIAVLAFDSAVDALTT